VVIGKVLVQLVGAFAGGELREGAKTGGARKLRTSQSSVRNSTAIAHSRDA
jgi:hypothetical protein